MAPDDSRSDEAPDPREATAIDTGAVDGEAETVVTPASAGARRPAPEPAPDPHEATAIDTDAIDPDAATVATPGAKPPTPRSEGIDTQAETVYDPSQDDDFAGPPPPPELEPGSVLFGEYVVEDRIGAGGMGEVYKARHRRLGELRAIKVVRHHLGGTGAASRLFDREARALLKISHPAVVRCHDLLSDEEGRVYLVMEFVEGVSLWDRIRARPLDHEELRALADRLAAGLTAAHAEGVVHRDLSPDNVVLPDGSPERAKLIDFGIAKELERAETTILEGFKGKLLYASPEQLGFYDGVVGPASDYYSLGLLLAAAAAGRSLEMGGSLIQAVEARRSPPELPEELPDDLRRAVRRLLAQDPAKRPPSLDLLRLGRSAPTPARRGPWLALAGVAGAAALGAGVWFSQRESAPAVPPPSSETSETSTLAAEAVPEPPPVVEKPAEPAPPEPAQTAAVAPAPRPVERKPRAPSAAERAAALRRELQVEGMLAGARAALEEDRLTSPSGDNAVEKYRAVLALDPDNREARSGLEGVGGRYIELAGDALGRGDVQQASDYVKQAAKLAPNHPKLAATRAAVDQARGQ